MDGLKQAALSLGTIAIAAAAYLLVRNVTTEIALTIGVAALVVPILWLLVSSLRPAMPDRTCPSCKKESLRLFAKGVREGARCPECGFEDRSLYVPYLIDVDEALDEKAAP